MISQGHTGEKGPKDEFEATYFDIQSWQSLFYLNPSLIAVVFTLTADTIIKLTTKLLISIPTITFQLYFD